MGTVRPAFVPQFSSRCSCFTGNVPNFHYVGNGRKFRSQPQRVHTARIVPVSAVQVKAVSGGNDGEVHEGELEKSYSVGVTIVSGCDAELRRRVIENIVAGCTGKRVVVVTASGISSTIEQDGADGHGDLSHLPEADLRGGDVSSNLNTCEDVQNVSLATVNLEGWLSCSSYEEMGEVISKLAASREYDYIVAEGATSTSIGPQQIATLLQEKGRAALRIDTLVSVLDGDRVLDDLPANSTEMSDGDAAYSASDVYPQSADMPTQGDSEENGSPPAQERNPPLEQSSNRPMLIVNLVENANVIILNRQDGEGSAAKLEPIQSMISVLNRRASIIPATDCTVPVQEVVNTNLYDSEDLLSSASWKLVLIADRAGQMNSTKSVPKSLKDSTFVYRAGRPFHPERLSVNIRDVQTFSGVIRSTGKIWLATRMLAPLEWNQAGESATLQLGARFWASRPESEWPKDEAAREVIMRNWDNQFGDRETELVFVGMGVDKERLQGLLDGCLLQDEEMVFTNLWENFEDPFIEWVPLIEDDEDLHVEEPSSLAEYVSVDKNGTANDIANDSSIVITEEKDTGILSSSNDNSAKDISNESSGVATEERDTGILGASDVRAEMDNRESENSKNGFEGALDDNDVSDELLDKASVLDVLAMEYLDNENSSLSAVPADDGHFDEEAVVLSSGNAAVADEILQQMPKIGLPVTIVTGFLGSGKTTLLNYILTAPHGLRVAVLVNEFGEIDIDSQLVEKGNWSSKDEVMELANGCICCNINDSFVNAVTKILERKDEFDYLIVETTGVADPVPVLNSLMVSDIADDVRVDGVLTVVAADSFENSNYMESEAARSQISSADTILLSKTDIATEESIEKAMTFIKSILPSARILRSQRGRVPIDMILDVGLRLDSRSTVVDDPKTPSESSSETYELGQEIAHDLEHDHAHDTEHSHEHGHEHEQDHAHAHSHSQDQDHVHSEDCAPDCTDESHSHSHNHLEADGFMTTSFRSDIPLVPEAFMEKFLQQLPADVFRAKGLLSFYGYPQRIIFQLSGRRYAFEEDEWPENVAPGNQIVIIGRNLNIDELQRTLEGCHVQFDD